MPIKISHTNKKNTSIPVQVLLDSEGKEVKNFSIGPNQFFYAEQEFITSSMRIALQRQIVKVEQVDEIPTNMNYYVIYAPGMTTIPSSKLSPSKENETEEHTLEKPASELVKEYTEEQEEEKKEEPEQKNELKTGKWDEDEEMYLKRVYPRKGAKYVAEKLNRAEKSVYKKVEILGLRKKKSS